MRASLVVALAALLLASSSAFGQRATRSAFAAPEHPRAALTATALEEPDVPRPHGMQIVAGYMGSILIGFLAWRAFDEPAGHHAKVEDDWGYTPNANTALSLGSFAGASLAVWGIGRRRGASGTLLGTALGAAVPTIPILLQRDDPMLPSLPRFSVRPCRVSLDTGDTGRARRNKATV